MPAELSAAIAARLDQIIAFARTHSPFYRDLYAGLPDSPTLADLPLVDHAAYWAANDQHDNRLLTGEQAGGIVLKTGGTTSAPRVSRYTRAEWREMAATFSAGLPAAGLRDGDRVANLFYAGELYSSFIFTLNCLQDAPVDTVHLPIAGSAPLDFTATAIADFSATVLAAPPTTLCRLAEHVTANTGALPSVRLALFSGESFYGDQRALLASAFPNAEVRSIGYASVDGGIVGAPVDGEGDTRMHRAFPDRIVELLDPETGRPVTEPGVPGRVVVTDLVRRLQPVLRYPVGDLAEWAGEDTFRLLGRSDEGARVGPVTLYLDDLRAVVESATSHSRMVAGMQVVLRRMDAKDQLVLRVACQLIDPERFTADIADELDRVRPMFADHVERGLIAPLAVELTGPDGLAINPRSGKLVRLIDERGR
ncbi:phenylacetate-CoA ligase [Herbihabitans rhizosphaerae]|uniref:Phenylacetate-CoA ligase n=1 Tax=Herbihabitans rhizosphaerae TaxID=1872711 RepID=A0A4Q7L240_9PSEU|nr:phenylacetate--CoA ligase family protein [Herbihabitans rhizosphaerae]RZS43599.1 phenylacetate-CoA ligase [Herbihabitans rhizosphaerae]